MTNRDERCLNERQPNDKYATNNPMHGSGEVGRIYNGQSFVAAP